MPAGTNYDYIINRDVTGDPLQGVGAVDAATGLRSYGPACRPQTAIDFASYPDGCNWPSIHPYQGGVGPIQNVVWHGTQADVMGIPTGTGANELPPGKYLISVQPTDSGHYISYEVGGIHFEVGADLQVRESGNVVAGGLLDVPVQPNPIPLATERIDVFQDTSSTNGEYDHDTESPNVDGRPSMKGFKAVITDVTGEAVTTDAFGNPICSDYQKNPDGSYVLASSGSPILIPGSGGRCVSDKDGHIVIPNLQPGRVSSTVTPPLSGPNAPPATGAGGAPCTNDPGPRPAGCWQWSQTTTLEGGHDWDNWLLAGSTGFDTEKIQGSENVTQVTSGWVHDTSLPAADARYTGGIKGTVVEGRSYFPATLSRPA